MADIRDVRNPDGGAVTTPHSALSKPTDPIRVALAPETLNTTRILGGSLAAAGTLMTIPANRVWRGSLSISNAARVEVGGAGISAESTISHTGTGAVPAATTLLGCPISLPAVTATATAGVADTNQAFLDNVVLAAGSGAITVTVTMGTGITAVRAVARGLLD